MISTRMFAKTVALATFLVLLGSWAYATGCIDGDRYEDMGDGTVMDCRTGLVWLQDANCTDSLELAGIDKSSGYLDWGPAMKWVAALGDGHCGLTDGSSAGDWRLPTDTELMAMVAYAKKMVYINPALTDAGGSGQWTNGDAFNNVISYNYWSSTTNPLNDMAWGVTMYNGNAGQSAKTLASYVWPVRGGQSGTYGKIFIQ